MIYETGIHSSGALDSAIYFFSMSTKKFERMLIEQFEFRCIFDAN